MAWGWMRVNPAAEVAKLPEPPGRTRFLADDERQALVTACVDSTERTVLPFVLCALSSGARAGELLALRWRDVNLTDGTAVIHTSKAEQGRTLYFVGTALAALKGHSKVRPIQPDSRSRTMGAIRRAVNFPGPWVAFRSLLIWSLGASKERQPAGSQGQSMEPWAFPDASGSGSGTTEALGAAEPQPK